MMWHIIGVENLLATDGRHLEQFLNLVSFQWRRSSSELFLATTVRRIGVLHLRLANETCVLALWLSQDSHPMLFSEPQLVVSVLVSLQNIRNDI
jgi:hypothetical protein